jgi:hypothetical protein
MTWLNARQGPGRGGPRPAVARLAKVVSVGAVLSLGLTACGGSSTSLTVSVSSGPVGTMVSISGKAGSGCTVDKNWLGFDFQRQGHAGNAATQMTTQVASNGAWSASFRIPAYTGSTVKAGLGAPVTAGRYEFVAPNCSGHGQATAAFRVTGAAHPAGGSYVAIATSTTGQGYWLAQAGGRVTAFGDAKLYPAAGARSVTAPVVGFARTVDGHGYWVLGANGAVYPFGDARSYGSPSAAASHGVPAVGIASTPNSRGYWILTADGHVYGYGNAKPVAGPGYDLAPYDAIGARTAGGYIVTAADDGAIYVYPGGALSYGGPGAALGATLVGTAVTPSGNGAWQAGSDGGVITWGADAHYYGSVPGEGVVLEAPVTAIASTPDGHGYWLLGANGSIYNFGDAGFFGPGAQKSK